MSFMMKLEPNEGKKPESTRKSCKNPVVHEPGEQHKQAATMLLWSDLKDNMILPMI